MSKVIRVALPGYDIRDTNLDHFSLYSDIDNLLIKRFLQGTDVVADGGTTPQTNTYNHNLGYIPFFAAFSEVDTGKWALINNQYGSFTVPPIIAGIDTSNLKITNFQASNINLAYDIFYDDMDQSGSPSIAESKNVFKVARPNKNILSTNPNDYIMHSDLNNFKILKEGSDSLTLNGLGIVTPQSINHGANIQTPIKFFCFIKFPDGKTLLCGGSSPFNATGQALNYDESMSVGCWADSTKIYFASYGAATKNVTIKYYIYGSGKDNTINNSGKIISVAANDKNVLTETNPDNFNFHSNYATLKYYESNNWNMGSITAQTIKTIPHNLGYVPFFIGFSNDLQAFFSANTYALMPYYLGRSDPTHPTQDVAAFMYADDTNIYLKAYYQTNAVGTPFSFNFYYKLFKNNLGL